MPRELRMRVEILHRAGRPVDQSISYINISACYYINAMCNWVELWTPTTHACALDAATCALHQLELFVCLLLLCSLSLSALILSLWWLLLMYQTSKRSCCCRRSFNNYYEPPEGNIWPDNFTLVRSQWKRLNGRSHDICVCVRAQRSGIEREVMWVKWNYRHYWMAFYSIKSAGLITLYPHPLLNFTVI